MKKKTRIPADAVQKAIGPRAQGWIMDYLLANDRWLTVRQIAKGTGKNAATIRRGLNMLVLARFVSKARDTRNVYKVTNREAWLRLLGGAS